MKKQEISYDDLNNVLLFMHGIFANRIIFSSSLSLPEFNHEEFDVYVSDGVKGVVIESLNYAFGYCDMPLKAHLEYLFLRKKIGKNVNGNVYKNCNNEKQILYRDNQENTSYHDIVPINEYEEAKKVQQA